MAVRLLSAKTHCTKSAENRKQSQNRTRRFGNAEGEATLDSAIKKLQKLFIRFRIFVYV